MEFDNSAPTPAPPTQTQTQTQTPEPNNSSKSSKSFKNLRGSHDQNVRTPEYILEFIRGTCSDPQYKSVVYNEFAKHFGRPPHFDTGTTDDINKILDFVPPNHTIDILQPDFNWWNHYKAMKEAYESKSTGGSFIVYINPPYGNIDKFVIKANEELAKVPDGEEMPVLILCPLRSETTGFHSHVLSPESKCFLVSPVNGSIKFQGYKNGLYSAIAFLFFGNNYNPNTNAPDFRCIYTTPERLTYLDKKKKREESKAHKGIEVEEKKLAKIIKRRKVLKENIRQLELELDLERELELESDK